MIVANCFETLQRHSVSVSFTFQGTPKKPSIKTFQSRSRLSNHWCFILYSQKKTAEEKAEKLEMLKEKLAAKRALQQAQEKEDAKIRFFRSF